MTSHGKAQELAKAVGREMYSKDRTSQFLDIALDEIRPGYARMSLRIGEHMVNGHGMCHGGFIFMLADSAFAYSCNSHNHNAVASGCMIEFLAPAQVGDLLIAVAEERLLAGRSGIYDIDVTNQDGKHIAVFRGKSHRIQGETVKMQGE
ncbi:MAG: Acyl-coenzyme A thioesterase PaaI [Rhodocyclaceae bacterium]|nr:MAG: hydroxyphenylacetyl-CoA thioesterase PaaI [Rhodocyclaceae bacterium]MBE7422932.1 hydroxyphenylacetyl-CoA thioesterase PaaI [Zoogloeaceae bacterium]MBV6408470.1 Acyl-coenzyme A thioesterase PaaI [Rhodocyclaceae bacterium]MCK6385747.1 hydroxyphenylacetyl-CoA thioesterase PaaI [Rhodocyclaceae bacterium]